MRGRVAGEFDCEKACSSVLQIVWYADGNFVYCRRLARNREYVRFRNLCTKLPDARSRSKQFLRRTHVPEVHCSEILHDNGYEMQQGYGEHCSTKGFDIMNPEVGG
jgi:hypothetical protein